MRPLLAFVLLLAASVALAHEFWLAPPAYFVAPGTTRSLRILVGENFQGERWAGKSNRVTRLLHSAPGAAPLDLTAAATAADTLHPAVTFAQPGTHLVALATTNAFLTLDADKFNAYLKEDGLDDALRRRQQRGQLAQPGREAYRRCAKTLVLAGPAPAAADTSRHWARPLGLALELVPEQNPYALAPGASLTVRVLADGQPQAGQLVHVWQRRAGQPVRRSRLRSNQNGRVLFRLPEPGQYLLSAVHMVPAALPNADWQSTWSTLTFGFGPAPKP